MTNTQNILEAAKKLKATGGQPQGNQNRKSVNKQMMEGVMATSSNFADLENLYFNPQEQEIDPLTEAYEIYPNGERRKVYDPQEELKEIKSFNMSEANQKLPQAILESMMQDPLIMPTDGIMYNGEDVNNMMDSLQNRQMDILEKLDARDKQGKQQHQQPQMDIHQILNETQQEQPTMDYRQLANLIESIIDKKFAQYSKTMLNESKSQNGTTLSFVKLGDTFTFMDSANNVYECKMVYKGKGKVKKS